MIETNAKLKPCPFCGSGKVTMHDVVYDSTMWSIACGDCGAEVTIRRETVTPGDIYGGFRTNKEKLTKVWNDRANVEKNDNNGR